VSSSLVLCEQAKALDAEASACWGLHPFALVEAAGRQCAGVLAGAFPRLFAHNTPAVAVLAGKGNNAADALVLLRSLILQGRASSGSSVVFFGVPPGEGEKTPFSEALISVRKLGVRIEEWHSGISPALLGQRDLIIDGIAGTGINGPLRGSAREMAEALNALSGESPLVLAIDMPSGAGDNWKPGMPLARAGATLAIEPMKLCLYKPALRAAAGEILPVRGIFPPALLEPCREAELLDWETAASRLGRIPADAYKYRRGTLEIFAGSPGAAGAAKLAALGAQAAGAGLVRLLLDPPVYPLLAGAVSGVMAVPLESRSAGRFQPDAALLGPGWGRGPGREALLETCISGGLPLVLDADAIHLAKGRGFDGNVILTPHAGEFAAWTGIPKEEILADPAGILRRCAAEKNAVILFKSHVLFIAAPDGRLAVLDGMNPALAAGGSGDLLGGLCAGIAARMAAERGRGAFDAYTCASAAAALFIEAAGEISGRFIDPSALALPASLIAGKAWLGGPGHDIMAVLDG
jgi:NAD(P)H-hydrate epimerase